LIDLLIGVSAISWRKQIGYRFTLAICFT